MLIMMSTSLAVMIEKLTSDMHFTSSIYRRQKHKWLLLICTPLHNEDAILRRVSLVVTMTSELFVNSTPEFTQ